MMKDALDASTEFFNLPMEEKMLHASDNVKAPVRYGTSVNHVRDEFHFWRDFIKLYSHPISDWVHLGDVWILYLKVISRIFMHKMYSEKNLRCLVEILENVKCILGIMHFTNSHF